jgi:primosomal protein N' (replication factor Y)
LPSGLDWTSLKEVIDIAHEVPPVPLDVLSLCRWAHEYYLSPLGEVLSCASPLLQAGIRKLKQKPVQASITAQVPKDRAAFTAPQSIDLSQDQRAAVEQFELARQAGGGRVALLHGVTGSGKTEVYIELARKALRANQGVLFLVPEIALTPQLHCRIEEGLGVSVGLWHSAMSNGKRRDLCLSLARGEMRVVVGARSAVFAPIQNLGLIVVDEEHDATYKQEDRVRYHARDLAVVRAKITQAFVILGSATPSLETWERVREGRYSVAQLGTRIAAGGMPSIGLIDLKVEQKVSRIQAPLALCTLERIQRTLDAGEQVIVYLNRRGFAAFLLCKDCGKVSECPHCSVSLTVHKLRRELKCHHCGYFEPIRQECAGCQGSKLHAMGAGTESLEVDLPRVLTGVRLARLDRDLITSAARLKQVLDGFRNGESNLLLGTQMLVKGHDFPNVTLVVVILADALFRWPDFRASERALQILTQVSGRAGRGSKAGHVLVQAFDVSHPVLDVLTGQLSEESFLDTERELRRALRYPPYGRIARMRIEGATQQEVVAISQQLAGVLRAQFSSAAGFEILGPSEAFLEKSKGTFRWDLLLKTHDIQVLQKVLRYSKYHCKLLKTRMQIDVDPYGI